MKLAKIFRLFCHTSLQFNFGMVCDNVHATWTRTAATKLEILRKYIMRFLIGRKLQDHITIESMRFQTKVKPISPAIKEAKLKFLGHIKRSSVGLSKLILEGRANGTKNQERPKRRWIDDIKTWICLHLGTL